MESFRQGNEIIRFMFRKINGGCVENALKRGSTAGREYN